jgi:hypothetical protein
MYFVNKVTFKLQLSICGTGRVSPIGMYFVNKSNIQTSMCGTGRVGSHQSESKFIGEDSNCIKA